METDSRQSAPQKLIALIAQEPLVTILTCAGIATFWAGFLWLSGCVFSGYHLTDDHELPMMHYQLNQERLSILQVMQHWLSNDLPLRFRPFYFIHRVLQTAVLGLNPIAWSVYYGIMAIFTTITLYCWGRFMRWTIAESLLLAWLTTLGAQSVVWWQLGPQEGIGMALFSLCLWCIIMATRYLAQGRSGRFWDSSFILVTLLLSLIKESFVVFVPAVLFLRVWASVRGASRPWWQAIQHHRTAILLLLAAIGLEILYIRWFIVAGAGRSEFARRFSLTGIFRAWQDLHPDPLVGIVFLTAAIAGLIQLYPAKPEERQSSLTTLWPWPVLYSLVVFPQTFVYAHEISHRYILPGIFGVAIATVAATRIVRSWRPFLGNLMLGLLLVSLILRLNFAWNTASAFSREGISTQTLFSTLQKHSQPQDTLVVVTHPMAYVEWNLSLNRYLRYAFDRPNLFYYTFTDRPPEFYQLLRTWLAGRSLEQIADRSQIQCFVIFPELQRAFLRRSEWFQAKRYQHWIFGGFNRNQNPESEIHLYCRNDFR